jgi:hypothetical protein
MQGSSVLDRVDGIEKYDRLARRNYGLSDNQEKPCSLSLDVLCGRGRVVIAIDQSRNQTPPQDQA